MNRGILGISVGAAFVLGMIVSAGPVYGPHFQTWDGTNWDAYMSTVQKKLTSTNKFFAPPGEGPFETTGDAEITLKLIQDEIDKLQADLDEWKRCDCYDPDTR